MYKHSFFHEAFWFLALYFHLKVYHIKTLSFVSVVLSSRRENRRECLKFLRQDLKYLFEVKGENQFLCYFFLLYDVKHVVLVYQRLGFFYAVFYLFAIMWWVMLLRFLRQVGIKLKNTKIRKRMSWILSSSWPTWPE